MFIFRKKRRGSAMLLHLITVCVMMALLSPAQIDSISAMFSALDANRTGTTSFNLAESKASTLKATPYSSLAAEARAAIPGVTGYEQEVTLGAEIDLGGGNKKRDVTVNVYKTGEAQPRETQIATLSSQGSVAGLPSGTIILWSGSIASIPTGFVLCDGLNSTPDLRNRFIVGAGRDMGQGNHTTVSGGIGPGFWGIGDVGGEELHTISVAELPSHAHKFPGNGSVYGIGFGTLFAPSALDDWSPRGRTDTTASIGDNQPHNNLPPYFALAYIMKQ